MSSLTQEQQPETTGQLLERFRDESVVVDSAEFAEKHCQKASEGRLEATG